MPNTLKETLHVFLALILIMIAASQLQGMLVLDLTKAFGLMPNPASSLYAAYGALIFSSSVIGGFVGGRYISHQKSIVIALFSAAIALFLCGLDNLECLKVGLAFFVLAAGIVVPNAYSLLGHLHPPGSAHRQTHFTLAYTSMNVGALIAFLASGVFLSFFKDQYSLAFLGGSGALLIGTLYMAFFYWRHPSITIVPTPHNILPPASKNSQTQKIIKGSASLLGCLIAAYALLTNLKTCSALMIGIGVSTLIVIATLAILKKEERNNLLLLLLFFILALLFWAFYLLQPTLITLFVDNHVQRVLFGSHISTPTIMGANSFYMIFLGPFFAWLWFKLRTHNCALSTMQFFSLGLFLLGLAFLSLSMGISFASPLTSAFWVLLFFFFLSVGEMIIAPAGYASIGELVKPDYQGLMLGIWQMFIGVSASFSGMLAQHQLDSTTMYETKFTEFGLFLVLIGLLCFASLLLRGIKNAHN